MRSNKDSYHESKLSYYWHKIVWLIVFMPGAVILWVQYMFPNNFATAIGSARRRKSRLVQFWYTITFYLLVTVFVLVIIHSIK